MARKDEAVNLHLFRLQEGDKGRGNPFLTIQKKEILESSLLWPGG